MAAALLLIMLAGGAAWWAGTSKHPSAMYFYSPLPFAVDDLALSADGRTLAMVAYFERANGNVIWIGEIGGRGAGTLGGTQGATYPFWSPDGRFIGFFADGKLKKVDVSSGQSQVLCDAPNGRGGTWNRDGVILFTPDSLGVGLFRVSSSGGSPVELTKPDASRLEQSHRWPVFLPDGKHFLYMVANFSGQSEINAVYLGSLDSNEKRLLVSTSANAAYAEPGYLVYLRDKSLVAQPFDLRRYVLSGEQHTLNEEVLYFPTVDRAVFGVSSADILVAQTGQGASLSQLTWIDRGGKPMGAVGGPGLYANLNLSPDGGRVVEDHSETNGRNTDIWVHGLHRDTSMKLTFGPSLHQAPVWSPDGKRILYSSNAKLGFHLYLKNADGSGSEEEVPEVGLGAGLQANAWDWSGDGKYALFSKGNELWHLSWLERVAKPLLQAKWTVRNAQFSPDGRWIAYASNETGNWEVYVSPFPSVNGKWQVSNAGGQEPRWRRDGKELFYLSADAKMMAVAVKIGTNFESGAPVALFLTRRRTSVSASDVFSYDVSADGQRFLINTKMNEGTAAPLSVLLNWASKMEK